MQDKKSTLDEDMILTLIDRAQEMRKFSYCPYSGFSVGAALLAENGEIFGGCNIENSAYSPTICAERTALSKAVSEGVKSFKAMAIVGGRREKSETYSTPCGSCRQFMREFCDPEEFDIIIARSREDYKVFKLEHLLPQSFGPENLAW